MRLRIFPVIALGAASLGLAACGGGSGGGAPPVSGSADLTWTAPTRNEDGSALTNLAGYKVHYGLSAGSLTQVIDIPSPGNAGSRIEGLTAGTWYFTVVAYTNTGVESRPAGPVWKTIR